MGEYVFVKSVEMMPRLNILQLPVEVQKCILMEIEDVKDLDNIFDSCHSLKCWLFDTFFWHEFVAKYHNISDYIQPPKDRDWRWVFYSKIPFPEVKSTEKHTGLGSCIHTHGQSRIILEGEFKEGKLNGKGMARWHTGKEWAQYIGDWKEGEQYGYGEYRWEEGDVYTGEWVKNLKEGHGVYKWANGDQSEGDWSADQQTGHGTLFWRNGNSFSGMWVDGSKQLGKYYEHVSNRSFEANSDQDEIDLSFCHPLIANAIHNQYCTYHVTERNSFFQYLWKTKEIDTRTHGICVSCKEICYQKNNINLVTLSEKHFFGGNFYCDCGSGNLELPCRAKKNS